MLGTFPLVLASVDGEEIVVFALLIFGTLAWVLIHNIRKGFETRQREQTRRDIAAYVAEGSIRPQDVASFLNNDSSQSEATIANGVAWGTIHPEKAESLIRSLKESRASAARA